MAHDVLDIIAEDPEVQHVPDEMHPASVEKHTREQSGHRREVGDLRRNGCLPKHYGGDGPVPIDKQFCRLRWERDLVQEDQRTGDDKGDGHDRSDLSRGVVVKRDYRMALIGGGGWRGSCEAVVELGGDVEL